MLLFIAFFNAASGPTLHAKSGLSAVWLAHVDETQETGFRWRVHKKGVLGGKTVPPYRRDTHSCGGKRNIKEKPSGFFFKSAPLIDYSRGVAQFG